MEDACKESGLSISVDPFYSENNLQHLERIVRDIKEGTAHFAPHDLIEVN